MNGFGNSTRPPSGPDPHGNLWAIFADNSEADYAKSL